MFCYVANFESLARPHHRLAQAGEWGANTKSLPRKIQRYIHACIGGRRSCVGPWHQTSSIRCNNLLVGAMAMARVPVRVMASGRGTATASGLVQAAGARGKGLRALGLAAEAGAKVWGW
jgi:hypothetical protein